MWYEDFTTSIFNRDVVFSKYDPKANDQNYLDDY